jgi:hypothetical protein
LQNIEKCKIIKMKITEKKKRKEEERRNKLFLNL